MSSSYGQWLTENRKKAGWSRNELAERSGYSSQQIYNLEKGLRDFSLHHLELFSELFNCSISLIIKKGEIEIMSTENIQSATVEEVKETKLLNDLQQVLDSIEAAIKFISTEKTHGSFEVKINELIDELWDMGYSTNALEQVKREIVENFIDSNEEIQSFIKHRQAYLFNDMRNLDKPSYSRAKLFKVISDFEFDVEEESIFGIAEQLTKLYNTTQSALCESPEDYQAKDVFDF